MKAEDLRKVLTDALAKLEEEKPVEFIDTSDFNFQVNASGTGIKGVSNRVSQYEHNRFKTERSAKRVIAFMALQQIIDEQGEDAPSIRFNQKASDTMKNLGLYEYLF